jgi:lycopene beta-cyclase
MLHCTARCRRFSAPSHRSKVGVPETFDLVILGGGCAGLSLSMALAAQGARCPRTLVIESRTAYSNDRTWCFWRDRSAPDPYPVRHSWPSMRVSHAGQSVVLDCGSAPYQMLTAQDFYAAGQASIDQQANMVLRLGTSVVAEPSRSGIGWTIRTSAGTVTARAVVDTRPPQPQRHGGATLWQSFYGREIECSAPVFDPLTVDLMDFLTSDTPDTPDTPDAGDVRFIYVLPVTPTRALVEVTAFGATPLAPRDLSAQLDAALAQRVCGAAYTTLRSEHGVLPMGLLDTPRSGHPSYVKVGVMAGGARPSTGYAFQRIQQWSGECAHALLSHGQPVGHQRDPWALRSMDQIFLDVLRANPSRGAALFFSLFSRTDAARVIRFLSGHAGVVDSLAVVAAMPVLPFASAALTAWRRRGGTSEVGSVA